MATSKEEMYAKFQPWVLATYGDSAKTKTITVRKAARIRALLSASDKVTLKTKTTSVSSSGRKKLQTLQPSGKNQSLLVRFLKS